MASENTLVGRRKATAERALSLATSMLPHCVLSRRCSMTSNPPVSRIAITTGQLFFRASASAAAMAFLACSRLIGVPYAGGGGGVCALAEAAVNSTAALSTTARCRARVIEASVRQGVGEVATDPGGTYYPDNQPP